jgi:hypothetical protein
LPRFLSQVSALGEIFLKRPGSLPSIERINEMELFINIANHTSRGKTGL